MPIPRNWVEELAVEWLAINGYLTETNVRLKAPERGGVAEADVVGAKISNEQLHIIHIETGSLAGGFEKDLTTVRKKFEKAKRDAIEGMIEDLVEWEADKDYEAVYIASYAANVDRLKAELKQDKIEFLMLQEFIRTKVFEAIDRWKRRQLEAGRRKTVTITLPECHWLLNLLDFLRRRSLLSLKG